MVKTVLVVDDEVSLRRLLGVVLGSAGYRVVQAEGGVQALEGVRASPPDLCVLDVMMPRVDGWEVLRSLRAEPATVDLPVVMLTAKGQPRDRLRGWELGCDAYIPKPFEPPDLVREVLTVLARTPAERRALRERQLTVVRAMLGGDARRNGRKAG